MFRKTAALTAVLSLACILFQDAQAQPVNGPLHRHTRVEGYDTDWYEVTLRGGELTTIVVDGDGDTDLDLFVYNQAGRLVAIDNDELDYCVVSFRPPFTGKYRIEVRNLGSVFNRYSISVR